MHEVSSRCKLNYDAVQFHQAVQHLVSHPQHGCYFTRCWEKLMARSDILRDAGSLLNIADSFYHCDAAVCTAHHSARHTAVLSAWHQAALAAHTTACAIREPADHSSYSPGNKRPDLYITSLNLALDVKTASLFTSSASQASARLAAHTPIVATAEPFYEFYLRAFGDPRSGSSGEYSRALGLGTTVNLLLTEVTGARHAHAERFLRLCAAAHAARFPHLDGKPSAFSFYAVNSALLSVACLRGLGGELRARILSRASGASLRRRPPCAPSPRPPPRAHPRLP
ncbi:hypothetical protein AB1Y20_003396 [Prymnesium parvum]|uniref:Uncharacterized protein n=1 Tax=Prymnesium parvum TaxID=97485 RepID=A0AB34JBG5_PRYPA